MQRPIALLLVVLSWLLPAACSSTSDGEAAAGKGRSVAVSLVGYSAQPFTLDVGPSYLLQYVVGFELVRRQGFTMQGAFGYAQLLNKGNTRLIDGSMTPDERTAMNVIFKSGPVVSMAFGTSFK